MRNLSYENEFCIQFYFHANQNHFHKNGFAIKLALKQRHEGTRKWPINHVLGLLVMIMTSGPCLTQSPFQTRSFLINSSYGRRFGEKVITVKFIGLLLGILILDLLLWCCRFDIRRDRKHCIALLTLKAKIVSNGCTIKIYPKKHIYSNSKKS